jgi:3-deoxy-manno-octulosonate cytidylyltransferase (CMP-KDO synthetase)
MKIICVIPARLESTRLPRKILRLIAGETMLARVHAAAAGCRQIDQVIVATDSEEVLQLCRRNGWKAEMTSAKHRSGSDRVQEIAGRVDADVYINLQGDEPLAKPEHLAELIRLMQSAGDRIEVGTLKTPCPAADVSNPNAVKVTTDKQGRALYFSRSPIPYDRDANPQSRREIQYYKHLGFYAYRKSALDRFCALPESGLERAERLEQLRFLENGIPIYVAETPFDTIGVDTEEDLARVEEIIKKSS